MALMAMLILAFGPLHWSFPWWVWILGAAFGGSETTVLLKDRRDPR